jgi:hypothetical protein
MGRIRFGLDSAGNHRFSARQARALSALGRPDANNRRWNTQGSSANYRGAHTALPLWSGSTVCTA